eukprot:m.25201 g.25201  ORF g.25201 m.25201 type:complete len:492 (-) comp4218_c0_seq1:271-1746(-)
MAVPGIPDMRLHSNHPVSHIPSSSGDVQVPYPSSSSGHLGGYESIRDLGFSTSRASHDYEHLGDATNEFSIQNYQSLVHGDLTASPAAASKKPRLDVPVESPDRWALGMGASRLGPGPAWRLPTSGFSTFLQQWSDMGGQHTGPHNIPAAPAQMYSTHPGRATTADRGFPETSTSSTTAFYATSTPVVTGSIGAVPSLRSVGTVDIKGVLEIVEQPTERGRFRYAKERRRTPLPGRSEGSFPTVRVSKAYRDIVSDGVQVQASVVTRTDGEDGRPVPHWHRLEGRNGESVSQPIACGTATFCNLVVIRSDRNAYETYGGGAQPPLEDAQVIRILFEISFRMPSGELARSWVTSDSIYGCDLKIQNMSHSEVSMSKGQEVILLTSKIKKQHINVMLVDSTTDHGYQPGSVVNADNGWKCGDDGKIYCMVQPTHVHHQYALVADLPPYWEQTKETRRVSAKIIDNAQKMESNCMTVKYVAGRSDSRRRKSPTE